MVVQLLFISVVFTTKGVSRGWQFEVTYDENWDVKVVEYSLGMETWTSLSNID